jgi:ABC-type sugar transport system substrate-binding protein
MRKLMLGLALATLGGFAAGSNVLAQDLLIATSLPSLEFPFFVHMQKQLDAEAAALGNIELLSTDGQNSTPKQTSDIEAAIR